VNRRTFRILYVVVVLIAALFIRLAYIAETPYKAINDAGTYNRLASGVARTGDYQVGDGRHTGAGGSSGRTAYFPPGFPYFLAVVDIIDGHTAGGKPAIKTARVSQAALGTVTVGLIGLVGWEAFGEAIALVAMALAAVYPVFIEMSGVLMSENLLLVFELAAVWTALRAQRARYPYVLIGATGILLGLATLTHQNAIVFVIPLGFAAAAAARPRAKRQVAAGHSVGSTIVTSTGLHGRPEARTPGRDRWWHRRGKAAGAVAVLVVTTVLMILPWTIRNAIELHHFIPVSDETGITLVGTYNPTSAAYSAVPYKWRFFWKIPEDQHLVKTVGQYTEPALSSKLQSQALSYIGDHPFSPLAVAFHNTLRMFELEGTRAWHASAIALDIPYANARTGVVAFWLLCLLALAGIATSAARSAPRWIWWLPVLYAVTIVLINVETPRFREPIDPFLILLAACAVVTGFTRLVTALRTSRAPI
jgi:Dolichyl-phosphate-mannose-protein mannosyltransferase